MAWEYNVHHGDYSSQYWIVCFKVAKNVGLTNSHYKKNIVTMYSDGG